MRKYIICLLLLATALYSFAQQTPKGIQHKDEQFVFDDYRNSKVTEGGSFELNCSVDFAVATYKEIFKRFPTKRTNKTDYVTTCFGGTVKAIITGTRTSCVVETLVEGAALPKLNERIRLTIMAKMNIDSMQIQINALEGMNSRLAKLQRRNVSLEKKVEQLKAEIANCKAEHESNDIAIDRYENALIPAQKSTVNFYKQKVDAIQDELSDLPNH